MRSLDPTLEGWGIPGKRTVAAWAGWTCASPPRREAPCGTRPGEGSNLGSVRVLWGAVTRGGGSFARV